MGKAHISINEVDIIKKIKANEKKQAGRSRADFAGVTTVSKSLGGNQGGGSGGSASTPSSASYVKTSGDTMMGPLAFYPSTTTMTDDYLSVATGSAHSSRIYVIGEASAADNLESIRGPIHAGQILFFQPIIAAITLQDATKAGTAWADATAYVASDVRTLAGARYVCHTAHTSATATNRPATGSSWEDFWYRNNIKITGADEREVGVDEIVLLQYDLTDGVWIIVSGGGSSGGWIDTATSDLNMSDYDITTVDRLTLSATGTENLATTDYGIGTDSTDADNLHYNVPTGKQHEFDIAGSNIITMGASTVTSQVALSVQSSLTVTGTVSFTGATQTLGNSSADTLTITAHIGAAIDMNTEDLELVDRLKFSTSGTDNLAITDTGIATDSTDADDLHYNVPTGRSHEFDVAGTQTFHISPTLVTSQVSLWVAGAITVTGNTSLRGDTTLGNSTGDDVTITGRVNGMSLNASSIHAYNSTEVGFFTKSTTGTVGTLGSMQIPYSTGGVGSAAVADSHFGSDIGCMGIYTSGNPVFVIKTGASTWHALIFTASPTTYSF